jgi:dienelactone hydrolase
MNRAGVLFVAAIATAIPLAACEDSGGRANAAIPAARSGDDPHPAKWIDDSGIHKPGWGRVVFKARDGNAVNALVYRPRAFDPAGGPIWFVMHGASRDAERYVRAAAPVAERYGALVLVPHFTKQAYPKESDYTLGVTLMGTNRWRDSNDYVYAEIEHLFEATRRSLSGRQQGYYLFGHSAGAQFTHRLLTFLPRARVLGAVAANAGWYTLPTDADPRNNAMPYGLKGSPIGPLDLQLLFARPFVVLLGDRDTHGADTDSLVRGTPEAEAQGATRLERGRFYFDVAKAKSEELHAAFNWRLAIVRKAGHDAAGMIDSAGFFLFAPGEPPCVASRGAEGSRLMITEILADPPKGPAGDANGDGIRDPSEDELVEIVNTGKTPVCLSGWVLGDAKEPERHVFPLGHALPPGRRLVVFGGGVPTGRFEGADVQWATKGLDLSNAGDVITLRDGTDAIVRQVSWGDCDGAPCASDHWPGRLDIAGPLVRPPVPGAAWSGPAGR